MLSLIVCTDLNGAIGDNGELLAHIPSDLSFFKSKTVGKPCIMGRKTFESIILKNGRPLTDRLSVVITNKVEEYREKYKDVAEDVVFTDDIDRIIELSSGEDEVVVCGGESIYKIFLPYCDFLYVTTILEEFESADTYFPIESLEKDFIPIETHSNIDFESMYSINRTLYKRKDVEILGGN